MKRHPLTLAYETSINESRVSKDPMSIDSIRALEANVTNNFSRDKSDLRLKCINYSKQFSSQKIDHIGLNTVGMLADRLSILCIKLYMNSDNSLGSQDLINSQILDIEKALAVAKKGRSSSFNKVTTIQDSFAPKLFDEAAMRLASTNLLLWLAQEVLYMRGPESLPDVELRKYIVYFAEKNILRNKLIFLSEELYWNPK